MAAQFLRVKKIHISNIVHYERTINAEVFCEKPLETLKHTRYY
jgi:hypothetical protein